MIPPALAGRLRPIDDAARDGSSQLVFGTPPGGRTEFAIASWRAGAWQHGSGIPLPYEPNFYCPEERA